MRLSSATLKYVHAAGQSSSFVSDVAASNGSTERNKELLQVWGMHPEVAKACQELLKYGMVHTKLKFLFRVCRTLVVLSVT